MTKCDLCDADCNAPSLIKLREVYQIPGVVDICPKCEKWAAKLKSSLLDEVAPKMRAAISERKNASSARGPNWFQRFIGAKQ